MKKFFPTPDKLSQELLATMFAVIVTALIVANVPALRKLVKDYETNPL